MSANNRANHAVLDAVPYGSGPDDSLPTATGTKSVTLHVATIGGLSIPCTVTAHAMRASLRNIGASICWQGSGMVGPLRLGSFLFERAIPVPQ
jgi:uncharacterized membrane protein